MTNVIDLNKRRAAREAKARRKALFAKHPELADVRVADRAFRDITAVLLRFGYTQAEIEAIKDTRQVSLTYEFVKLIRSADNA